jgi:hypothetical protein
MQSAGFRIENLETGYPKASRAMGFVYSGYRSAKLSPLTRLRNGLTVCIFDAFRRASSSSNYVK